MVLQSRQAVHPRFGHKRVSEINTGRQRPSLRGHRPLERHPVLDQPLSQRVNRRLGRECPGVDLPERVRAAQVANHVGLGHPVQPPLGPVRADG